MMVLVLGGGPDGEREVSVDSATRVARALERTQENDVRLEIIDKLSVDALRTIPGDVIIPMLHGPWGEGGALQDLLVADGRPFAGCLPGPARLAMDKVATKTIAAALEIPVTPTCVLNAADPVCPLPLPVVIKPIHEGSTLGLYVCRTHDDWLTAHDESARSRRACMIEPFIEGRELTLGVLDGEALPLIEITAAEGLYDYEAKYQRDDTSYLVNPDVPPSLAQSMSERAIALCDRLGVRHLARLDYILDADGTAWILEVNTTPGFTDHSLFPMAAAAATPGPDLDMPTLCSRLVNLALRDGNKSKTTETTLAGTQEESSS